MFFALLGLGNFLYGVVFTILTFISDCDVELWFYEKFGKSPRTLKGKVVFITGASSGIGEHTAYALARYGVKLVIAARRREELERVKKQCIEVSQGQLSEVDVLVLPMDVTDFESHRAHFERALHHFGQIDILVNNAGRSQRAMWEQIELEVDRQMFDLNVFAVVNLSRVAIEYFKKVGQGHIAVVSSLAGVMSVPYSGTYTATKFSIHGYFHSLRIEKSEEKLYVTLLCPGPVYTNFLEESFTGKAGEKYDQRVQPTDRRMTAERCGYLNAVALANKTYESWIALSPLIPLTYARVYFPVLSNWAIRMLGPKLLFKLRDSKNVEQGFSR